MYAYYCFTEKNWEPSKYAFLPQKEKALVIAFIDDILAKEKKSRGRRGRRGRT